MSQTPDEILFHHTLRERQRHVGRSVICSERNEMVMERVVLQCLVLNQEIGFLRTDFLFSSPPVITKKQQQFYLELQI